MSAFFKLLTGIGAVFWIFERIYIIISISLLCLFLHACYSYKWNALVFSANC